MVAIVSGNSLGLSLTSLNTLGQRGALGTAGQGRNAEQAYVNIANGNLVLQDLDDKLVARGADIGVVRTYNSQGLLNDDNGDNWVVGAYGQKLKLTGTVGAAGSTMVRIDRDGASATYAWNPAKSLYVSSAGAGAVDTIAYDAANARYVWTDGSTGLVERYETTGEGRLLSVADPAGNTISYAYNANGTLQSMVDANGETTYFDYSGTNLTQIRTVATGGAVLTRVRYAYDGANRLSSVTVDLSPEDGSIADGKTYVTTYAYDGTSKRIASVTQSDGTSLSFTYQLVGADYRVASVKDGLGQLTTYTYDTGARSTKVKDPLGLETTYVYDAAGQLTQMSSPPVGGTAQVTLFAYDADGNVIRVTDPLGQSVDMFYDANGNQRLQRDAAGNTVTRTFDARNQLLTETVYLTPDPDAADAGVAPSQPLTTRYVYDAAGKNQLRFVLSPEGRVTEYRYDSYGQRTSSLEYGAGKYNVAALGATAVPTETELATWTGTQDRTQASRIDTVYDARGQVQKVTVFGRVDASGNGVADASQSITQYVYDRAGLLLSTISATAGTTTFTYDGKGRQLSAQDALNQTTLTSYDDANNKTVVSLANGLITTSAYDKNGRLVSVAQGTAQTADLGTTRYAYDKNGRLYQQTDPTGVRTARLYDEAGRLVGEVDSLGRLTEYVYDRADRLIQKVVYATPVNAPALAAYFTDPNVSPVNRLATLRPAPATADQKSWRIYDSAGRLVRTVDGAGAVVDTVYDGASRVVSTTGYSQVLSAGTMSGLGSAATSAATKPVVTTASDRVTRRFYDNDGLLLGTLDAEGYLTESRYDAQGRLVQQISYATATTAGLRAAGTLAQLIPATSLQDRSARWLYDARDRIVGQIDAEGFLTENIYDASSNITSSIRYATALTATVLGQITSASTVASVRPAVNAADRTTTAIYDKLNRVTQRTNFEGTFTQYTYDKLGNVVTVATAAGTTDVRLASARYDVQGRLVGELAGVGSALLVAGLTQAQIDDIWTQYGITHAYDLAGRRISSTDGYGNKTLFFYDSNGQLTHTVNALGEVTERQYDSLGQLGAIVQYGARLVSLTGLVGGLVNDALTTAVNGIRNVAPNSKQSFTYTVRGQVSVATDAQLTNTTSTYNAFGELTGRTQDLGGGAQRVQSMSVDRRGLVTGTVSDASGVNAITSAVYDAFGRLTRSTDANNNVQQQGFDRLGRVVSTTDALGAVRSSTYDAFDRVLTQTDALGRITSYVYDKTLRTVTVTTPENISVKTAYTRQGQKLSVVDGNGNTTSFAYDKNGNLLSTSTALTTATSTYDRANRLVQTKDANGNLVELAYDAANRLLTRTVDKTGLNLVTVYGYDAKGQQISITDPNGTVTKIYYDLNGQVLRREVDPTGLNLVTQYTYDGAGKTLTVIDPNGVTTQYVYDKLGRRTQERIDPAGLNIARSYVYDKNGNLTSSTDANGQVTRYAYDAEDRLAYTLDPVGNLLRTRYDDEGRVVQTIGYATPIDMAGLPAVPAALTISQLDAKAVTSTARDNVEHRVLDKDGRLVATVNGLGEVVKYVYDANGNVVDRIAYANRIALASWTVGSVPAPTADAARDQRLRTVYDQLGRAIYTIDGVGAVKRTIYDANGNVVERLAYATTVPVATAATASALAAAINLATNPQQLGNNLLTQSEFANGVTDAPAKGGAVTAATMTGLGGAIRLASDPAGSYAYKTLAVVAGVSYTFSVIVEMEDGQAPSFGSANVATAANSFGLVMFTSAISPAKYTVQDLGNGRYRVSVTATAPASPAPGFGVVKYVQNDTRAFRVSGYQLEQADTASRYTATTTAPVVQVAPGSRERFMYDRANRLTWSADGVGAVVQRQYDKNGNLLKTIEYPVPVAAGVSPSLVSTATGARITDRVYDRANRQVFQTDALGGLTETVYDGNGNVTTRYGFAKTIALPTTTSALTEAQVRAARVYDYAGADRVMRAAYDAANRQVFAVDAVGAVVETGYDALGNAVRITSYVAPINLAALQNNWTASASAVRTLLVPGTADDRVVRRAYDAAGRLVYSADPLGYVTRTTYDGLDRVTQTTQFAQPIAASVASNAIAAAVVVQATLDRSSSFVYDAAGRVISTTDPLGYTESHVFDGLGLKTSFTNKKGSVWTYVYDAAGRMTKETSPAVEMTAVTRDANGNLVVNTAGSGNASLVTQMTYDALGNLKSRTEAVGRAEQRTTSYEYDAVGHQVRTIFPPVGVYNPAGDILTTNGASGLATRAEQTKTLDTLTTYDVFGNAIANRDVAGNFSYKAYDVLGHVRYEVDALGFVTGYQYDVWGQVSALTRYATATTLVNGNPASLSVAQIKAAAEAAGTDVGKNRVLLNTYDRAGRLVKVVEPSSYVYDSSAGLGAQYATAGRTTANTYNAFGELTRVALLKNSGQNTWVYTNNYYDLRGQQVATVDAMGYLTTQVFDGAGNVTKRIEFANAIANWNGASAPAAAPTTVPDANTDRQTTYVYDRGGRKTSETRAKVEYSASANGISTRLDLTTSYAYDAVGNLTQTTDAAGGVTLSYYDALGRVRTTAAPATGSGNLVALTKFQRDAYGNVVVKTETHVYKSAIGADALAAPGASMLAIGQSLTPGQAIYSTDGRYQFVFQADGNLVVYDRNDNNQVLWSSGTGGKTADKFQFQADGNLVLLSGTQVVWSAGKAGLGGTQLAMQADGKLALLNASGTAVWWFNGTDANWQINEDRVTLTQYDSLGHATQSRDAKGYNHYSSYDAQGHLAKEWQLVTDGDNVARTMFRVYQYDKLGQQTHVIEPASTSVVSGGTVTTVTQAAAGLNDAATEYNAFGEATRKGVNGGRQEYFDYDNAGRVWRTNSGDGVDKIALYDLLGNQTANITSYGSTSGNNDLKAFGTVDQAAGASLRRTDMVYDALGRLTTTIGPKRDEYTGGLEVSRLYSQGSVSASSAPLRNDGGVVIAWSGTNTVNLAWSPLRSLGSGDVKVVMEYASKAYPLNPDSSGESGAPQMLGGQIRTRTQVLTNVTDNTNGLSMSWADPAGEVNGGIERVTKLTIYKKDAFGYWQPVISQGSLGYSGQVIDIDAPDDPATGIRMQIRPAGSSGDTGWTDAALINFGEKLRYDASVLKAGSYEYRVTQVMVGGASTVTATGTVKFTSPPLSLISVPMGFGQLTGTVHGNTSPGLFAWQSPGASDEQVFRFRVAGSNGAWQSRPVTAQGTSGKDGVNLTDLPGGNYEYELLWTHVGDGNPYAHATGVFTSTGAIPPQWIPPVNLPVIDGLSIVTVGGSESTGEKTYIRWNYPIHTPPAGNYVFQYRLQGASQWSTLTIAPSVEPPEPGWQVSPPQVDISGLAAGTYEYKLQGFQGTTVVSQALGRLINQRTPIKETRTELRPISVPVQVGSDPIYAKDEGGNIIYETVTETRYEQRQVPVWGWTQVPRNEYYQVWVQGAPQIAGYDEQRNPIYVRDMWGNIQYDQVQETRVRVVYDTVPVITGYTTETYPVQVQVQKPVITGYQPRYENQIRWVEVSYEVQVGMTEPRLENTTPPYSAGYMTPLIMPIFAATITTVAGSSAVSENNTDAQPAVQTPGVQGAGSSPRPVVNQNTDRWGNVVSISDPRSTAWVTSYRYNANNQMVEQKQIDGDGNTAGAGVPVTQLFYDRLGRQIAVKDANGNLNGKVYDARGNLLQELHADTGVVTYAYNVFGDKVSTKDAMDKVTTFTYDSLGRLLSTDRGSAAVYTTDAATNVAVYVATRAIVETSTWDELGRKLDQTNGDGEKIRYTYDMQGRIVRTVQPMGQSTKVAYDNRGNKIAEVDGNGYMATWSYSYFGKVLAHTDFGGRAFAYTYDNAGQLTYDSGMKRTYTYNSEGLLASVSDAVTGQLQKYEYDFAGNRVREQMIQGGVSYQDNRIAYDALGRMRWVADGRAYVSIEYDKVGNRTRIKTHVLAQDNGMDSDRYFKYDSMNRQIVVDGANAAGEINVQQGHRITYDKNGNRTKDEWYGNRVVAKDRQNHITGYDAVTNKAIYDSAPKDYDVLPFNVVTEDYRYDALDRLTSVVRDGVQTDARVYDGADRVIMTGPGGQLPKNYATAIVGQNWDGQTLAGTGSETRINRYDDNGRLLFQTILEPDNSSEKARIVYGPAGGLTTGGYDNAGNLLGYTVFNMKVGGFTNYTNTYERAEGYRQKQSNVASSTPGSLPGATSWVYGNGNDLQQVLTLEKPELNNRRFVSDIDGNILYSNQAGQEQYQLVVNGEVLGRYGQLRDEKNTVLPGGVPLFAPRADFNFGYQPIDDSNPGSAPRIYAVAAGDTLQSIARAIYGDQGLWYLIADANGVSGTGDLKPGQVLTVPARVGASNNANSFRPYDPTKVIGDTTPGLVTPQQKSGDGGCGGLGQVIVAVVTAVVAFYTGFYLDGLGITGFANGALSGVAGSIAGQAAGNAIGAQDGFSWKDVALAAIGNGIAKGGLLDKVSVSGSELLTDFARGAVGNAMTQGVAVVTGLQKKFDWKAVVASAVGRGVGSAIGRGLGPQFLEGEMVGPPGPAVFDSLGVFGERLVRGTVAGVGGGLVTAALRGGRVNATQVVMDAFGNALGEAIVSQNQPEPVTGVGLAQNWEAPQIDYSLAGGEPVPLGTGSIDSQSMARSDSDGRQAQLGRIMRIANEPEALHSVGTSSRAEVAGTRAEMTNADFEFTNRVIVDTASQNGEDLAPTIANAARLRLEAVNGGLSGVELAQRFSQGFVGALKAVTVEPVLQVRDMGAALASVTYNELIRSSGDEQWFPEMKSGMAQAYDAGASQTRLLLQSNTLTGMAVASYDLTTAFMNHDWGAVAEMGGGLLGGFALGKATSAYGGYGVRWAPGDIGKMRMQSQRGATSFLNFELVGPSPRPSLSELRAQYGVNEANLLVEATFEHQGKLFYDVNQTARNLALATDDRLPIYSESRMRLGDPNQTRAGAHAEVGAMAQSYEAGARGGSATLTIMGKDACTYCVSDVKKMALHLQLDKLTVIQPSGTVRFTGPQDFAPVKQGGKKWGK